MVYELYFDKGVNNKLMERKRMIREALPSYC